jgi:hypothetical protein
MHYMNCSDKQQVSPTFTLQNEPIEGDIDLPKDDILLETVNMEGKMRGRSVSWEQQSSAKNITASTFIELINSECKEHIQAETSTTIPEIKPNVNFISMLGTTATIDGSADVISFKSSILDQENIPLYLATTGYSGFKWDEKDIKEVVIKNITIYGDDDVSCIKWFIQKNIKINASDSIVPFDQLIKFTIDMKKLVKSNLKVKPGSSIRLDCGSDGKGMAIFNAARIACETLGFRVFQ